jgi:hypothetical protein
MLAVFGLGGWEILIILAVLGVMIAVPLVILGVVLLILHQQKKSSPPILTQQHVGH